MTKLFYRPGARVNRSIPPEVVVTVLERLRIQPGGLTPPALVDAARPRTAPLHGAFEWNNARAGELYREQQARCLIRSIQIKSEDAPAAPAYVNIALAGGDDDDNDHNRAYESLQVVIRDPALLRSAMSLLLSKLLAAQTSYQQVKDAGEKANLPDIEKRELEEIGVALATALALARRRAGG